MAKEYIKNTQNKLEESETTVIVKEYTLKGLQDQKTLLENEIVTFQKRLTDINNLLTKASDLQVVE